MTESPPTYDLELSRALGKLNRMLAGSSDAPALAAKLVEVARYNHADDTLALASLRHGLGHLALFDYPLAVLTAVDMSNAGRRPSQTHELAQDTWSQLMQGQGSAMFALVEQSFNRVEDEGFRQIIGRKVLDLASSGTGGGAGKRRRAVSAVKAFAESAGNEEIADAAGATLDQMQPK